MTTSATVLNGVNTTVFDASFPCAQRLIQVSFKVGSRIMRLWISALKTLLLAHALGLMVAGCAVQMDAEEPRVVKSSSRVQVSVDAFNAMPFRQGFAGCDPSMEPGGDRWHLEVVNYELIEDLRPNYPIIRPRNAGRSGGTRVEMIPGGLPGENRIGNCACVHHPLLAPPNFDPVDSEAIAVTALEPHNRRHFESAAPGPRCVYLSNAPPMVRTDASRCLNDNTEVWIPAEVLHASVNGLSATDAHSVTRRPFGRIRAAHHLDRQGPGSLSVFPYVELARAQGDAQSLPFFMEGPFGRVPIPTSAGQFSLSCVDIHSSF